MGNTDASGSLKAFAGQSSLLFFLSPISPWAPFNQRVAGPATFRALAAARAAARADLVVAQAGRALADRAAVDP